VRLVPVAAVLTAALLLVGCSSEDGSAGAGGPATSGATSTTTGPSATTIPADCPPASQPPERLVPLVEARIHHDDRAFTEGLVLADGALYESTGLEGRSTVREVDPATGDVRRSRRLDDRLFGEGLAIGPGGELVQLTWKDRTALVWKRAGLRRTGDLTYHGEGWGLTTLGDGTFVMSDGSDRLTERDPEDFHVLRTWTVSRADGPVDQLNELEFDGTHIWANRWQTDEIVRIDPRCHRVDGVVDASSLTAAARAAAGGRTIDVLNGIAHEPGTDRFLVTGKLWPEMFDVRFVSA
jgi:glutaminyl-peptide cyclotransferase